MSGKDLISWAVDQCATVRMPPTDANILMLIRDVYDLGELKMRIPSGGMKP